jgi:hypothetical protein
MSMFIVHSYNLSIVHKRIHSYILHIYTYKCMFVYIYIHIYVSSIYIHINILIYIWIILKHIRLCFMIGDKKPANEQIESV